MPILLHCYKLFYRRHAAQRDGGGDKLVYNNAVIFTPGIIGMPILPHYYE